MTNKPSNLKFKPKYYDNGQIKFEVNYSKDGKKISRYSYYQSGQKKSYHNFENGEHTDWEEIHSQVGSKKILHVKEDKNLNPEKRNGSFRYWKFVVNAAVRYGEILDVENSGIAKLKFNSTFVDSQPASNNKTRDVFEGLVTINNSTFDNTRCIFEGEKLITFFPISNNPEAFNNKLGGLVDYFMDSKSEAINKERLASFYHDCYLKNPIVTAGDLIVMDFKDRNIKELEDAKKDITTKIRDELSDEIRAKLLSELNQIDTDDTREIAEELKVNISDIKEERELQIIDADNQRKKGKEITVVKESTVLVSVDRVKHGKYDNLCIRLTFDDDTQKFSKIQTWDRDGLIESKAKTLIGKEVRTTCWDPAGSTKWSDLNYFNNIFKV